MTGGLLPCRVGCGCLAAGRARVRLAATLPFLAAALCAFVVGRVWACLAADLFFLLRVCGVARVCRRAGGERAVCECVAV